MNSTLREIKLADQLHGGSFFSEELTSQWQRKALPDVYGGRYFITAEYAHELGSLRSARQYRIAEVSEEGMVHTLRTSPASFRSSRDARNHIKNELLGGGRYKQNTIDWGI